MYIKLILCDFGVVRITPQLGSFPQSLIEYRGSLTKVRFARILAHGQSGLFAVLAESSQRQPTGHGSL